MRSTVDSVSSVDVHPEGDNVIVGSHDGPVMWYDLDYSDRPYKKLTSHKNQVHTVRFHPQTTVYPLFASAGDNGQIHVFHGRVYDDLTKNPFLVPLKIIKGHKVTGYVFCYFISFCCVLLYCLGLFCVVCVNHGGFKSKHPPLQLCWHSAPGLPPDAPLAVFRSGRRHREVLDGVKPPTHLHKAKSVKSSYPRSLVCFENTATRGFQKRGRNGWMAEFRFQKMPIQTSLPPCIGCTQTKTKTRSHAKRQGRSNKLTELSSPFPPHSFSPSRLSSAKAPLDSPAPHSVSPPPHPHAQTLVSPQQ